MAKIISIIALILLIILSPPAVLALVSQDALPGDPQYIIKRKLEEGILTLASIHPTTKSWFSITRSERRFVEARSLIDYNKNASQTLEEFVIQTNVAVEQIKVVKNPTQKKQLVQNLSQKVAGYDAQLEVVQQKLVNTSTNKIQVHPQNSSSLASPEPKPSGKGQTQPVNDPQQIQKIREEIKNTLDDLEKESIISNEPIIFPQAILSPQELPPEILEVTDLDKYLSDLRSLDVLDIKLLLPEDLIR